MELLDLLLFISSAFIIVTSIGRISGSGELVDALVSFALDLVHFSFFCQNLIREWQRSCVSISASKTTSGISVFHLMDHKTTISSRCEKPVIVKSQSHALNRTTVSLHFRQLLKWEFPDLDGTWMAYLTHSSESCLTVGENLNLANIVTRLTAILIVY